MALLRVCTRRIALIGYLRKGEIMKLTLKKILALVAGGLAVVAFIMAFVSPLKNETPMGVQAAKAFDVWFEEGGTIIPFIAFIVALLAGAYLIVRQFIAVPNDKIFFWVAIGLLVVAAVGIFLTEVLCINSTLSVMIEQAKAQGMNPTAAQIEFQRKAMAEAISLNIGAILGGILAALSAVVAVVAEKFIKD